MATLNDITAPYQSGVNGPPGIPNMGGPNPAGGTSSTAATQRPVPAPGVNTGTNGRPTTSITLPAPAPVPPAPPAAPGIIPTSPGSPIGTLAPPPAPVAPPAPANPFYPGPANGPGGGFSGGGTLGQGLIPRPGSGVLSPGLGGTPAAQEGNIIPDFSKMAGPGGGGGGGGGYQDKIQAYIDKLLSGAADGSYGALSPADVQAMKNEMFSGIRGQEDASINQAQEGLSARGFGDSRSLQADAILGAGAEAGKNYGSGLATLLPQIAQTNLSARQKALDQALQLLQIKKQHSGGGGPTGIEALPSLPEMPSF